MASMKALCVSHRGGRHVSAIASGLALASFFLSSLLSGCGAYSELSAASMEQIAVTRAVLASRLDSLDDETRYEAPGAGEGFEPVRRTGLRAPGDKGAGVATRRGDDVLRLTEEEAVDLGLGESRQLAVSKAIAAAARAEEHDTSYMDDLELRAGPIHQKDFGAAAPSMDFALRVRPPHLVEQAAWTNAARAATRGVDAEAEVARLGVACEIRRAFGEVRLTDAELDVSRAILEARRKLLALAEERAVRGVAVQLDVSMAELSLEEARQDGLVLEGRRRQALAALAERLSLPHGTRLELVYAPLGAWMPPPLPSEEALIDAALAGQPELRVAAAKRDVSVAETRLARSLLVPSISFLQLGYELDPLSSVEENQPWSLSAGVEIPIPGFNRAGTHSARAKEEVAIQELNAEVERTVLEVRDGLRRVQRAREALEAYQAGPVAAAERAAREIVRALGAGQADLVRVTLLEERNAEIRQRLVKQQREYFEAYEALRTLVGGELPR